MNRLFLLIFTLVIFFGGAPLTAQQSDFATEIDECQNSGDVDTCLGDVAYRSGDASVCTSASDPTRCRNTIADAVELLCLDQIDPQDCFGGWGAQGVESACTYVAVEEQATCFVVAAAQSQDYGIIDRNFLEGIGRDRANATVAIFASEPALLDKIDDNQTYDSARVALIPVLAIGQDIELPDDYCTVLRGNWGGEYPEDADANATLCEEILAAVRIFQQADESEKEAILQDMLEAFEEGGEEATLAVLRDRLLRDPLEDAFIRGWCRADDAGDCTGAFTNMIYDPESDTVIHFPLNGPPRLYEAMEEGRYRMYYDTETTETDDEGNPVYKRYYGEIVIESTERFYWKFYNDMGNSISASSYYIPPPVEESPAD